MFAWCGVAVAEIELDRFVEMFGVDIEDTIFAGSDGDPGCAIDGGGENEAVVVVGVLTD